MARKANKGILHQRVCFLAYYFLPSRYTAAKQRERELKARLAREAEERRRQVRKQIEIINVCRLLKTEQRMG